MVQVKEDVLMNLMKGYEPLHKMKESTQQRSLQHDRELQERQKEVGSRLQTLEQAKRHLWNLREAFEKEAALTEKSLQHIEERCARLREQQQTSAECANSTTQDAALACKRESSRFPIVATALVCDAVLHSKRSRTNTVAEVGCCIDLQQEWMECMKQHEGDRNALFQCHDATTAFSRCVSEHVN